MVAEESFSNIRTVKAFATEEYEKRKFAKHNYEVYKWNVLRGIWGGLLMTIFGSLIYAVLVLIIWIGTFFYKDGDITLGELTSFLLYLIYLIMSIV